MVRTLYNPCIDDICYTNERKSPVLMKNKIIIKTCLMIVKWIDCNFLKKFLMPDSLIFDRYTGAISQPWFIQRLTNCDHDQPQDVTWHEWVEPRCRGREGDVARCCKNALYTVYMGIFAQYQSCITVTVDITQGINFSYSFPLWWHHNGL